MAPQSASTLETLRTGVSILGSLTDALPLLAVALAGLIHWGTRTRSGALLTVGVVTGFSGRGGVAGLPMTQQTFTAEIDAATAAGSMYPELAAALLGILGRTFGVFSSHSWVLLDLGSTLVLGGIGIRRGNPPVTDWPDATEPNHDVPSAHDSRVNVADDETIDGQNCRPGDGSIPFEATGTPLGGGCVRRRTPFGGMVAPDCVAAVQVTDAWTPFLRRCVDSEAVPLAHRHVRCHCSLVVCRVRCRTSRPRATESGVPEGWRVGRVGAAATTKNAFEAYGRAFVLGSESSGTPSESDGVRSMTTLRPAGSR